MNYTQNTVPHNPNRLVLTPPKKPTETGSEGCSGSYDILYDILYLDPVALWLTSTLITKLIFCNIERWEVTVAKRNADMTELTKTNAEKRVSDWQQYICGPLTKRYLAKDHQLSVITGKVRETRKDMDPFSFHILLLVSVSVKLARCVGKGIGNKTFLEIENWFSLMTQLKEQNLITLAMESIQQYFIEKIDYCIKSFDTRTDDDGNHSEFPFFDYLGTFINVAHINHSEMHRPNYLGDHDTDKTEPSHPALFEKWEKAIAYIFNDMFKIQDRGVPDITKPAESGSVINHLPFHHTYSNVNNETWKNADQNLLWEEKEEHQRKGIGKEPIIQNVHLDVLGKMQACLRDNSVQESIVCEKEISNLHKFEDICDIAECAIEYRQRKISEREKQRRSYVKTNKRGHGKPYIPRPSVFERDMFLLGDMSYFHKGTIKNRPMKRKRKYKDITEIDSDSVSV